MSSLIDPLKIEPIIEESTTIIRFNNSPSPSSPKPSQTSPKRRPKCGIEPSPIAIFKCSVCTQTFEFKSQQIIHEMSHKVKSTCQVCSKKIYKEMFEEHMKVHLKNKSYFCNFCNEPYANKHLLKLHLWSQHMKSKALYCKDCGRGFNDKRHFKNHLMTHVDPYPFKCDLCPKGYKRRLLLEYHMIGSHQTERMLNCSNCNYTTRFITQMKNHRTSHLKNFQCQECKKEFKERRYLRLHFEAVHIKTENYECLFCEKRFITENYVKRHLRAVHNGDLSQFRCLNKPLFKSEELRTPEQKTKVKTTKRAPKNQKSTKNPSKNQTFFIDDRIELSSNSVIDNSHENQTNHTFDTPERPIHEVQSNFEIEKEIKQENQNGTIVEEMAIPENVEIKQEIDPEVPIDFSIIPYQPRVSFSSIRHLQASQTPFTCPTCPKTFVNRSSLMLHEPKCEMKNDDENFLKCEFCTKRFSDEFTLEVHINVLHINAKFHECKECDFKTTKYFTFRSHRLTHMNLVKCEKCDKEFTNRKLMLQHLKNDHVGPSEFGCDECGLRFKSSVFLQRHVKTYHAISKFNCSYCDKSFGTRNELNQHIGNLWKIKKCSGLLKSENHGDVE